MRSAQEGVAGPTPNLYSVADERTALVVDLDLIAYPEALEIQRRLAALRHQGALPDVLLLCQHPPVITIGRSGDEGHILAQARAAGIPVHSVERGGDVTYHGPGQLVVYPILSLEGEERDLHRLLRGLEEVVLRVLAAFGLSGERVPGLTGVWIGNLKVCAMGVAVRHWVTLHGLALNVNTALAPFGWIVPCGLHGCGVTSMEQALGTPVDLAAVRAEVLRHFAIAFSRALRPARLGEVLGAATERGASADGDHGDSGASGGHG